MKYKPKDLSGERAIKILERLVRDLSGIDVQDMTTTELLILHLCAENPPRKRIGAENQINNGIR